MADNNNGPKRKRTNINPKANTSSPFATNNPYEPLAGMSEEESEVVSTNNEKVAKPPPIYVSNITNINTILQAFMLEKIAPFKHVTIDSQKVKFCFETIEGYKKAIAYFEKKNAQYHTYQMKSERNFRIVIRGLHHSCDTNAVMQELCTLGYEPVQMTPVYHPVTKVMLPLFFVDLKPNEKNEQIYDITRLYYAVVKIEPPKPKRSIIQCLKCQEFGHSRNYCHKNYRCVKCDGMHPSSQCTKPPNTPPVCVNCKGQHTANYRGCPVHVKLQNRPTTSYNQNKQDRTYESKTEIPTGNKNNWPSLPSVSYQKPYAEAASSNKELNENKIEHTGTQNNQTDIINNLINKMDNLLSLLQPLIQMLTQILPAIITK